MGSKYYVTMTDRFMSGWGMASGKNAKYVYECDTMEEAQTVAENARNRGDQKYINIRTTKPHYSDASNYVQFKTKTDNPMWYVKGFFKAE